MVRTFMRRSHSTSPVYSAPERVQATLRNTFVCTTSIREPLMFKSTLPETSRYNFTHLTTFSTYSVTFATVIRRSMSLKHSFTLFPSATSLRPHRSSDLKGSLMSKFSLLLLLLFAGVASAPAQQNSESSQAELSGMSLQQTLAAINQIYDQQGPVRYNAYVWSGDSYITYPQTPAKDHAVSSPIAECLITFPPEESLYLPVDMRKIDPNGILLDGPEATESTRDFKSDPHPDYNDREIYTLSAPPNLSLPLDAFTRPVLGFFYQRATGERVRRAYGHIADLCHGSAYALIPVPPPPPEGSGPTMEQTLEFINQMFVKSGSDPRDRVALYSPCLISYRFGNQSHPNHYKVDGLDPRVIHIKNINSSRFDILVEDPKANSRYLLGSFTSQDAADHVAKAWIHALALCHKAEAPPLF